MRDLGDPAGSMAEFRDEFSIKTNFSIKRSGEPVPGYMPSASSRATGAKGKAPSKQTLTAEAASKWQEGQMFKKLGILWFALSAFTMLAPSVAQASVSYQHYPKGIIIDTAIGIPTVVTGILIVVATMTNGGGGIASKQEVTVARARDVPLDKRPLVIACGGSQYRTEVTRL